jgi:hypothetical protein
MSVFCAHCRKRLILQNYVIKGYQAVKDYATCGDIVVEKRGRITAPVQVTNLTVKGTVQGRVEARGRVEVTKTGALYGDIVALALRADKGAKLAGFCRIGPLVTEEPSERAESASAGRPAIRPRAPQEPGGEFRYDC